MQISGALVFFLLSGSCLCADPTATPVEIEQGKLRGKAALDRNGGTFYSFLSVPYARPPLGKLRFKAPEPPHKWQGVLEATEDLPLCVQQQWDGVLTGQEDCLYLNVHTPEISEVNLKPVMVFIHGGAYIDGSGRSAAYGAEFLITEGIVLVTFNYRLGVFGFLNFADETIGVPGNAGLKDQVLALKWVKKNIRSFGGDPDSITIFGNSVGGSSVHMHMLSPMSKGLYHRAISQSGVALNIFNNGIVNTGPRLADFFEFEKFGEGDVLKFLQGLPVQELFKIQQNITLILPADVPFLTGPVVETQKGEPAFLTEAPSTTLESGNYNKVPYLLGFTNADGMFLDVLNYLTHGKFDRPPLAQLIPYDLYVKDETVKAEVARKLEEFYYKDGRSDVKRFVDLETDIYFIFGIYRALMYHLRHPSPDIYFYVFTADTKLNFFKRLHPTTAAYEGASHVDDLGYLFKNAFTPHVVAKGSAEDLGIRRMVKMWTNFAKYGNPTPLIEDPPVDVLWERITGNSLKYLGIETDALVPCENPFGDNVAFWTGLYENYTRKGLA